MQSDSGNLAVRARGIIGDLSGREQQLWFELVVDVAVGLYFYPRAFALMAAGDAALTGSAMTELIMGTVVWAVIISVVLSVVFRSNQKPEPKDERDRYIENTAGRWFGRILVLGILSIVGLIVVQSVADDLNEKLLTLTPLSIALLLLFSLMVASLVDSVAKLYCYRRGF